MYILFKTFGILKRYQEYLTKIFIKTFVWFLSNFINFSSFFTELENLASRLNNPAMTTNQIQISSHVTSPASCNQSNQSLSHAQDAWKKHFLELTRHQGKGRKVQVFYCVYK